MIILIKNSVDVYKFPTTPKFKKYKYKSRNIYAKLTYLIAISRLLVKNKRSI